MADLETPIGTLRGRLTQLLADWGAEMSVVLKDLEDLRERVDAQNNVIEALKSDAEEAGKLRKAIQANELETEKLRSELESKRDLINVLRKDADEAAVIGKDLNSKNKEIAQLSQTNEDLKSRLSETELRLTEAQESMAESRDDTMELKAMCAELDAKTSLIKSLRNDAKRAESLEERLDEKRVTIGELEKSLDSQVDTIAELKDKLKHWKDKYAALKSAHDIADSMIRTMPDVAVEKLSGDNVDADASTIVDTIGERTLAINMGDALRDARDAAEKLKKGKKKATAS